MVHHGELVSFTQVKLERTPSNGLDCFSWACLPYLLNPLLLGWPYFRVQNSMDWRSQTCFQCRSSVRDGEYRMCRVRGEYSRPTGWVSSPAGPSWLWPVLSCCMSVLAQGRGWGVMAGGPMEGAAVGSRSFK